MTKDFNKTLDHSPKWISSGFGFWIKGRTKSTFFMALVVGPQPISNPDTQPLHPVLCYYIVLADPVPASHSLLSNN